MVKLSRARVVREGASLDSDLKLVGEYGFRKFWRVMYSLGRIRIAARELLTLDSWMCNGVLDSVVFKNRPLQS